MEQIKENVSEPTVLGDDVLFIALELGEHILRSGGEISRAEDTITRICKAYGALHVDVTAILSMIVLTVDFNDTRITCTRRITSSVSPNLNRLSKLNDLSRTVCATLPTKKEVIAKMVKIFKTSIISMPVFVIGSALAALGFAIFFSDFSQGFALDKILAILVDALLAGAIAMPLCILSNRLDRSRTSPIVSKFIVCFLGGVCAMLLGQVIPICHPDIIMIGNIMNFIPGVAMTNSFRDLFGGEIMSGLFRLCFVIIDAIAIAAGYAVAILLIGGAI